jgi:DNA-binding PadR family transcriptional regulator
MRDKTLLLLGILSNHDVHGYQLNQILKMPNMAIRIGKANAYKLLDKFEQQGLVRHTEEQEGNRPPRRVYRITSAGKKEFERMLRERLVESEPTELPDGVSLDFIGLLSPQEALPLLEQRQVRLAARCEELNHFSDDIRASHPGTELLIRQAQLQYEFVTELVERYRKES